MQIEQGKFFAGLGYEKHEFTYPCGTYICYKNTKGEYMRVDHFWHFYVVEYAENEEEAKNNCFDDGDLFDDSLPEDELIRRMQEEMQQ